MSSLFFKTATDEELKHIKTDLLLDLTQGRQYLIETRQQIIEYLNQVKYQSAFLEKLKKVKYLRDQFEIKHQTNILEVLSQKHLLAFEPKPSYPLKLSIDNLQTDDAHEIIKKVGKKQKALAKPTVNKAQNLNQEELEDLTEEESFIDLYELKDAFLKSNADLFTFLMNMNFEDEVSFEKRVTLYCQMVAIFEDELQVSDTYARTHEIEYAIVYADN